MKYFIFLYFFLVSLSSAQNRTIQLFDLESRTVVDRATVCFLKNKDTLSVVKSSDQGIFTITPRVAQFDKINITHINYKSVSVDVKELIIDTIFLEKNNYQLDDLKIRSRKKFKWNPLPFTTNLAHEDKVATLVIDKKESGKPVHKIRAQIVDLFGVKNMKYLPFKVQIRTVNSDDNAPDSLLFESQVLRKKDNKKWFEYDISEKNIILPEEGLYLVFEILKEEAYPVTFIQSRVGVIVAVPQIKTKRKNNKSVVSYRMRKIFLEDCVPKWELQKEYYFNLSLEFN